MLTISYVSFSFFEGVRGTETGVGPSLEKGRGQEKAVSHPARSLTPTPTVCPDARAEAQGAALSRVLGGRERRSSPGLGRPSLSPKPLLDPLPGNTMNPHGKATSPGGRGGKTTLQSPGQISGTLLPSRPHGHQGARQGPGLPLAANRSGARRSLPRPAPTLGELQLQLRQLRPHVGRQRRHRGRRGLQASLRHPGSASHTPEDKRGGRRRDGLTRVHTRATKSGSGRRAPPAPLLPLPP